MKRKKKTLARKKALANPAKDKMVKSPIVAKGGKHE